MEDQKNELISEKFRFVFLMNEKLHINSSFGREYFNSLKDKSNQIMYSLTKKSVIHHLEICNWHYVGHHRKYATISHLPIP